jgi:hypothetical protein
VKPADWDEYAFTRDLMSLILNELYVASDGRLRGSSGLIQSPYELSRNPLFSIEGALREHLAMGFKARPSKQESAQLTSVTGPEPAEQGE